MDLRLQIGLLHLVPVGTQGSESNLDTEFGSDSPGSRILAR